MTWFGRVDLEKIMFWCSTSQQLAKWFLKQSDFSSHIVMAICFARVIQAHTHTSPQTKTASPQKWYCINAFPKSKIILPDSSNHHFLGMLKLICSPQKDCLQLVTRPPWWGFNSIPMGMEVSRNGVTSPKSVCSNFQICNLDQFGIAKMKGNDVLMCPFLFAKRSGKLT